jgi:hypothetical protein
MSDVFKWETLPARELKRYAKAVHAENKKFPEHMVRIALPQSAGKSRVPYTEAWRSRRFLCQVFDHGEVERLSICRTEIDVEARRYRDGITWDELQQVKSEVGRGMRTGCEIYPPDDRIVNVANHRHLWVWKTGAPLSFMW